MLELKKIKLYLQTRCKELVKFYLQRFRYRLYQLKFTFRKTKLYESSNRNFVIWVHHIIIKNSITLVLIKINIYL
jgi:hypothetical protein